MAYQNSFQRLASIMDQLREQCPWDAKQTIQSLRSLTLEETYELAEAIDHNDWQELKKELGDLLLHIFFYARIGTEQGEFTMQDVVEGICNKLVHRHPHIYSNVQVSTEDEVKKNWEQLKLQEGSKGILAGVPTALPAVVKALRVQEKVKQVGFEWENVAQVRAKIDEELIELQAELDAPHPQHALIEQEFGDVLFSMVNYARYLGVDPERALELTNKKFMKRFQLLEAEVLRQHRDFATMSLQEMDAIWNSIKKTGA
jgi:MazG family protein